MKEVFIGDVFHVPASVTKREILIGISSLLHWQEIEVYVEPESQFLIIKGSMLGMVWCLEGIYAPGTWEKCFFRQLMNKVE